MHSRVLVAPVLLPYVPSPQMRGAFEPGMQ